jgi:hypothetical protein
MTDKSGTLDRYKPGTWEELEQVIPQVRWLWDDWLPEGMTSMVVGAADSGKSHWCLHLLKTILEGGKWPDSSPCTENGRVVWLDTEFATRLNLDRARRWGIDRSRVVTPQINGDPHPSYYDFEVIAGWDGVEILPLGTIVVEFRFTFNDNLTEGQAITVPPMDIDVSYLP